MTMKLVITSIVLCCLCLNIQAEEYFSLDMSKCKAMEDACYTVWKKDGINFDENISGMAWFDITDFDNDGVITFFPLFNIFNRTDEAISVEYGLRLYDGKKQLLIEGKATSEYNKYDEKGISYETYHPMNSADFKIAYKKIMTARYISIVYKQIYKGSD